MGQHWDEWEQEHRRRQERPTHLWAIGAIAAFGFLALTHLARQQEPAPPDATQPEVARNVERPVVLVPDEASESAVRASEAEQTDRAASTTRREHVVRIYECVADGVRVVSDQPCAETATTRLLSVTQPDPAEVHRLQQQQRLETQRSSRVPGASGGQDYAQPSAARAPLQSNDGACDSIDRAIDTVNSQMRAGYRSVEGEYLRARLHDLKRRRWELGCGR